MEEWAKIVAGERARDGFVPPTHERTSPREKYDFLKAIGEGGFAVVWKCKHKESGIHVAIKAIDIDRLRKINQYMGKTNLDREIGVMKQMSAQDSIVQLIEVYDMVDWKVPSGMLFLVLELLEGVDLEQWVQKGGSPLRPFEAREILTQVGAALRAMHQCDMIHRDVKPSNVFLSNAPDGSLRATLLDFGLAKKAIFDADGSGGLSGDLSLSLGSSKRSGGGEFRKPKLSKVDQSRRLVRRGSLVGTRNFAAPEVVDCSQSTGSYDMTVDAFSLGRTIRFALTGTVNAGRQIHSTEPKVLDNGCGDTLSSDTASEPITYCLSVPEVVPASCPCLPFLGPSTPAVKRTYVNFETLPEDVRNTVLGLTHPNPDLRWSIREALSSKWAKSGNSAPQD